MFSGFSNLDDGSNQYISESDAKLIAINFVIERAKNDNSNWTNSAITISDTKVFYDLDNNANAYAFNLKKESQEVGYVFVNANVNSPRVEIFSYDGRYVSDKMISYYQNETKANLDHEYNTKKLYFLGGYDILITDTNSASFYNIGNCSKVKANKSDLKDKYNKSIEKDQKSKDKLIEIKKKTSLSSLATSSTINTADYTMFENRRWLV